MPPLRRSLVVLSVIAIASVLVAGCESTPPENPDPASVSWITYSNPVAGYSVDIPQSFVKQERSGDPSVLFRYEGFPVLAQGMRGAGRQRGGHEQEAEAEAKARSARGSGAHGGGL